MKKVRFKIFIKTNKIAISANIIIYSIMFICISAMWLLNFEEKENYLLQIISTVAIITLFVGLFMKTIQGFLIKPYRGFFQGDLIFEEDKIIVDEVEHCIDDIEKIEFQVSDYYDKHEYTSKGDFNPTRSNGTSNKLELKLSNGQVHTTNFQLTEEYNFTQMHDLLINYHLKNKIHFLRLIDYLGINDYDKIQEFKKTLPLTRPIANASN